MGYQRDAPGFLKFLGVEAPNAGDLNMYPDKNAVKEWSRANTGRTPPDISDPRTFPLHRKQVVASFKTRLFAQDTTHLPISTALQRAYRWLHDPTVYENLPQRQFRPNDPKVRLRNSDIEAWIEDGKIEEFHGEPKSYVHLFDVIETFKLRRRGICEPYINDRINKTALAGIKLISRQDVRQFLHGQTRATPVDAAAFYDQFALEPAVQPYFVFHFEGKCFTMKVLPMGFRPAADIAQLTAQAMLDLTEQTSALAYIDNFIFTGHEQDTNAQRFIAACEKYNLTLNEAPDFKWRAEMSQSCFDFLGEHYELGPNQQMKSSTSKTITKITRAIAILDAYNPLLSTRTIAAVFGILIYASSSHDMSLANYFQSMRYLGHVSRVTTDWSAPAPPIDPATLLQLKEWAATIAKNHKTPLQGPRQFSHDIEIQVDASAWGWGCLIIHPDGTVRTMQQKWPDDFNAQSSTIAEPMAAWLAICNAVTTSTRKVLLRTDHANLVFAIRRGHSHTQSYNECVRKLQTVFPNLIVEPEHIAGIKNVVADKLSRNLELDKTKG